MVKQNNAEEMRIFTGSRRKRLLTAYMNCSKNIKARTCKCGYVLDVYKRQDIYRREGLMEQRAKECSCYTVKQWEKLASMVDVYEKRTQEDCNGYEQFSSEICRALAEYSVKDAQVNVIKNQSGLYEVLIKTEEELSFDVESVVEEVLEKRMHLSSERHAKDGWILNLEEQEAYEYDVAVVTKMCIRDSI